MAENTDNEGGIDTTDFDINRLLRLPLGELGRNESFPAIANKKSIVKLAQLLKSLGDLDLEVERQRAEDRKKLKRRISVKDYFSGIFKKVIETLDIVLIWLEQTAKKSQEADEQNSEATRPIAPVDQTDTGQTVVAGDQQGSRDEYQKKESVLRGLCHIIGFGDYTYQVGLLERTCKFLDLPENPYNAKREHVKECLNVVEEKKQKVYDLVEKACDLLQEITNDPEFNRAKAAQFNNTVRQANVMIASCKTVLSDAEETIDELTKIMSTMKVFSRIVRFAGFGGTCYGIYHMNPSTSSLDSLASYMPSAGQTLLRKFFLNRGLKCVGFGALCVVAGYSWLSLFPSRAYAFRDDLEELKLQHKLFTNALTELEERLKIANEDFIKQSQSRGDSV